MSEKHHVRTRKKNSSGLPGSSSSAWSVATASGGSPRGPSPTSIVVMEPVPNRGQFVSTLVETARAAIEERDASGYFSWVRFGTVGSHAILDGALCSLAMHLVGKDVSDMNMIAHSRTMYGQSLYNLQQALHHPTKWRASETLCTAILLCIFEVRWYCAYFSPATILIIFQLFAGTSSSDSWLQHARGIGILMEQRGAKAHKDGWDAAMLLSFRGVLVSSSACSIKSTTIHTKILTQILDYERLVLPQGRRMFPHPPRMALCDARQGPAFATSTRFQR